MRRSLSMLIIFAACAKTGAWVIDVPDVFGPNPPILEPDDSDVYYSYRLNGTGFWGADPESDYSGLMRSADEVVTHVKTNGVSISTSRNNVGYGTVEKNFCLDRGLQHFRITNYWETCSQTNSYCVASITPACWYTGSDGNGPCDTFENDITWGPITTSLSCGTVTEGRSGYESWIGENGEGGACGPVPHDGFIGTGGTYELLLHLTPMCTNVTFPPPPVLNAANFNNTQPFGAASFAGSFNSNHQFQMSFPVGPSSPTNVYVSTNFGTWTFAGSASVSDTNALFVDTTSSNKTCCLYSLSSDGSSFSDAYGFVTVALPPGYSLIANPLATTTCRVDNLLPNVPEGSTLEMWGLGAWQQVATFTSGAWDNGDVQLAPGLGARIYVPTNTSVTFVGAAIQRDATNMIPPGISVRSSTSPMSGSIDLLGLTSFGNGDVILRLESGIIVGYTNVAGTWQPVTPSINVGEAVVIQSAAGTLWGSSFPSIDTLLAVPPEIDYCDACNWDPHWADGFTVNVDGNPVARPGTLMDLYYYGDYVGTVAVGGQHVNNSYYFADDFGLQYDQGGWFNIRFRNGDIPSPISNDLDEYIP